MVEFGQRDSIIENDIRQFWRQKFDIFGICTDRKFCQFTICLTVHPSDYVPGFRPWSDYQPCPVIQMLTSAFETISFKKKKNNYSEDLNTRVVQYLNGLKLSNCQMVRYWNSGLNTRLPYEYQTTEYWTSKSLFFRCFRYSDVRYSNPRCIWNWLLWETEYQTCLVFKWLVVWRKLGTQSINDEANYRWKLPLIIQ